MALLKSGVFFCKNMINNAISVFKSVLDGTLDLSELFGEDHDDDVEDDHDEEDDDDDEEESFEDNDAMDD